MPTLSELLSEVQTDSTTRGYNWPNKSNGDVYTLLNVPYVSGSWTSGGGWANTNCFVPVPSRVLLGWAADQGRAIKIKSGSDDVSKTQAVRSICYLATLMLNREDSQLDFRREDHRRMVDALRGSGILSEADQTSLVSLASVQVSRAYQLWGREVGIEEIRNLPRG